MEAAKLAAVSIATSRDVHSGKCLERRAFHISRKKNKSGACTKDRQTGSDTFLTPFVLKIVKTFCILKV